MVASGLFQREEAGGRWDTQEAGALAGGREEGEREGEAGGLMAEAGGASAGEGDARPPRLLGGEDPDHAVRVSDGGPYPYRTMQCA